MLAFDRTDDVTTASTSYGSALLQVPLLLTPILLLVGALWPEFTTWGISQWSVFPINATITFIVASAMLLVPALSATIQLSFEKASAPAVRFFRKLPSGMPHLVLSVALIAVFVCFGSRALVYGDGFTILSNSTKPIFPLPSGSHEISKFLPVMLHRLGYLTLSQWLGLSSDMAFRLTSSVGGIIGFWGIVKIAWLLTEDKHRRMVIVLGGLSSGCTLLFFGYAELYTFGTCALLWLLAFVIGYIKGRSGGSAVFVTSAVLLACNVMLAPLALLALLVVLRGSNFGCDRQLIYPFGIRPFYLNLLIALSSGLLFWLLHKIEPSFYSVVLLPDSGNQYWFLSRAHLMDIVNLLLLVAPISSGLLIFPILRFRAGRATETDPVRSYLVTAALAGTLLSFWIDPVMGSPRDWDLLSVSGFPLSLVAIYSITTPHLAGNCDQGSVVRIAALTLLLLVPNIYEKRDLKVAATRMDRLLWDDPHYQTDFDGAYRCLSWGALLRDKLERPDLAAKFFKRRLEFDSNCDICLYDLGKDYLDQKRLDSAATYLGRAASLYPPKARPVAAYAYVLQILGDSAKASSQVDKAQAIGSQDSETEQLIAMTFFGLGRHNEAMVHFRRCVELEPQGWAQKANIALAYAKLGVEDSSVFYYLGALDTAPQSRRQALYSSLIHAQIALGRYQEAQLSLASLLREFPNATDAQQLNALVHPTGR
jgi:tetratricopeptide (TPR) repeat protein